MLNTPHRRFNPLTREWILVSPQRGQRPWLGQVEKTPPEHLPAYDPRCYLCPGNERAGGLRNPDYTGTFVFDNDFAALLPAKADDGPQTADRGNPDESASLETVNGPRSTVPLLLAQPESGICRVVCFSPRHDRSLPELSQSEVEAVLATWTGQSVELAARPEIGYVQVFENKGALMGCSNPHPHSQIWASAHVPDEILKELQSQGEYFAQHGRPLLLDALEQERAGGERIVATNEHFTALVPFWAVWPFEILLTARRPCAYLSDLTPAERVSLADLLRKVTARYDNLFEMSFPYSMGFHQAPQDGRPHPEWVLHAHFYPPLLRSATVRKFMVGYEMLAQPQRDITPETAAARLRDCPEIHYRSRA